MTASKPLTWLRCVLGVVAMVATLGVVSAAPGNASPVPAGDGTSVTQQEITPMAGDRYCDRPDYGWYCFYADSDQRGWSIGKTACGTSDLPRWFWDYTSSWWDYQTGGAYVEAFTYDDRARPIFLFRTTSTTEHGGNRDNVPLPANDQADRVTNHC